MSAFKHLQGLWSRIFAPPVRDGHAYDPRGSQFETTHHLHLAPHDDKPADSYGRKGRPYRHVKGDPSRAGGYYHATKGNRRVSAKRAAL